MYRKHAYICKIYEYHSQNRIRWYFFLMRKERSGELVRNVEEECRYLTWKICISVHCEESLLYTMPKIKFIFYKAKHSFLQKKKKWQGRKQSGWHFLLKLETNGECWLLRALLWESYKILAPCTMNERTS